MLEGSEANNKMWSNNIIIIEITIFILIPNINPLRDWLIYVSFPVPDSLNFYESSPHIFSTSFNIE